jgi:hypothetical protein
VLDYFVGGVGVDLQAGGQRADGGEGLAGEIFTADEGSLGGEDHLVEDGFAGVQGESERCHSSTVTHGAAVVKREEWGKWRDG